MSRFGLPIVKLMKPRKGSTAKASRLKMITSGDVTRFEAESISPTDGAIYSPVLVVPYIGVKKLKDAFGLIDSFTEVKCRCDCADFLFTFAGANYKKNCLYGKLPKLPTPKGTGKPRNPKGIPGFCKHLRGLVKKLERNGIIED